MGCGAAAKSTYGLESDVPATSDSQHLDTMKAKDLKALLLEYDITVEGCIEKQDLIDALVARLGTAGAIAAAEQRLFVPQRRPANFVDAPKNQDLPKLPWRESADEHDGSQAVIQSPPALNNIDASGSNSVLARNSQSSGRSADEQAIARAGDRPDSLEDARRVLQLVRELRSAAERLEQVLTSEANALDKQRTAQGQRGFQRRLPISLTAVQVAQDRAVAIGTLAKDAQLEEPRLQSLIREVENGAMRLGDIRLPELVGPILEQLQGLVAHLRTTSMPNPPAFPPKQLRPPPLNLGGQIVAISRLQQEIASEEDASRSRVLALTNGESEKQK